MSLRQFLLALRARFKVFAVSLAAVVLAATLASLLMPKSYRATVSLLVDAKDEQSMGETLRALGLPQEQLAYLQTQADIIASPKVARRVVQQLKLVENPAALSALGLSAADNPRLEDQLVDRLQHALKVETSQSSVIRATFTCGDPRLAATIANAFADAYVDTMLELRVAPTREAAAWFDEQLKGLRANLEDAQRKLRADQDAEQRRLARHPERLAQVRDDTFIQQLRADLLHGEGKLRELSTQYGVNHPAYQGQLSENLELRARLQAELRRAAANVANGDGPTAPRAGAVQYAQDPAPTGVLRPVLEHNVESAERAYDTALQRYFASRVDSRAVQTNVAVLSPAAVPLAAFRPNIPLNLVLSLITGLGLGGALVALLERRDARVRCAEDLLAAVPLPLLAVLSGDGRRAGLLPRPPAAAVRALPRPG
ncbi:MAG TPA: Wzz/FepE/Etk N-terminal domain-containing protein [Steroidobacteraceae bacterium]|nr:Wzz/FepE/Etk N-terminal domain-containing protein [Steroidobacteraceae bacterium]